MIARRPHRPGLARSIWNLGVSVRNSRPVERLLSCIPSNCGLVLRYHSVNDDPVWARDYVQQSLVVAPDDFERHVSYLAERHRIVSMDELVDAVRQRRRIEGRAVAITFDDGYEDNYRFALPILRRRGATATFYITTGAVDDDEVLWTVRLRHAVRRCQRGSLSLSFLGAHRVDVSSDAAREAAIRSLTAIVKRSSGSEADAVVDEILDRCGVEFEPGDRRIMMSWDEITEMHRAGMTIGAHSVGHYNLPSLETRHLTEEVRESKARLESELRARVDHFAYPNGRTDRHFDGRVAGVVEAEGFRSAVTSIAGPVSPRYSPYCLPRLGVRARGADIARLAADIQFTRFARPRGRPEGPDTVGLHGDG